MREPDDLDAPNGVRIGVLIGVLMWVMLFLMVCND